MSVLGAMVCVAQIPLLQSLVTECGEGGGGGVDRRVVLAVEDWQEILQRTLIFCGLVLSGSKALRILVPRWRMTGDHSGVMLILYCMKLFGELETRKGGGVNSARNPMRVDLCGEEGGTGMLLQGWSKWFYCLDAVVIPLLMMFCLIVIVSNRYFRSITSSSTIVVIISSTLLISSLPNLVFSFQIIVTEIGIMNVASIDCIRIFNRICLVMIVTFNAIVFLWKKKSLQRCELRTGKGLRHGFL